MSAEKYTFWSTHYELLIFIALSTVKSLPFLVHIFSQHPVFIHPVYAVFYIDEKPRYILIKKSYTFENFVKFLGGVGGEGGGEVSKLNVASITKLISSVLLRYCSFDNLVSAFHSDIY